MRIFIALKSLKNKIVRYLNMRSCVFITANCLLLLCIIVTIKTVGYRYYLNSM